MKNLIKIFLLILIPVVGVFILSYPGVWKFRVESMLNRKILKDSGWELSIGELSGHLLKEVESKEIEIVHKNGTRFYVPELKAQFNLLYSLVGNINLKELNIFDFYYEQPNQNENTEVFVLPDLAYDKFPLEIDNLTFDGILKAELPNSSHNIELQIESAIHVGKHGLNLDINDLYIKHDDIDYDFKVDHSIININNRILNIEPFRGSLADVLLDGRITFIQDEGQRLNGVLNANNIVISEKLFDQTPLDVKFSKINSEIRFDTDFKNYSGFVTLLNNLGLNMTGDFNISKYNDRWVAQQILLRSDDANLFVHGNYINNETINAKFNLEDFDISKWITNQSETNISGQAELSAQILEGYLDSLSVNLQTVESDLFEDDTIKVDGSFVYKDNILNFSDPFSLSIGPSSVISEGNLDFGSRQLALDLKLNDADVFIINNFWNDSLESGLFSGQVNVYGDFDKIDIDGNIVGDNINYKDIYISELSVSGQREHSGDFLGSANVTARDGRWKDIEFESAELLADLYKNETHFNSINIRNKEEHLVGSAKFNNADSIYIENIKTLYDEHYFVNTTPIAIKFAEGGFEVDNFSAHFDDGVIGGQLKYSNKLDGKLNFSNISSELLYPIINNPKHRFTGLMFGEITFHDSIQYQNIDVDLSVKNGVFTKQPFEHMKADLSYNKQLVTIDELTIREKENSTVEITGQLPYGERKTTEKIILDFDLKETDYETIAQFLPDWYEIKGVITGQMSINGFGTKMLTNVNGSIKNGKFELIEIGEGSFRGSYDGQNLIFNSFSSDRGNDHYTGYGFLPIDLNLHSDNFGDFRDNDSLYIFVEGKTSNLDFITNYFDEVDSAPGDYTLALELSGIWDNIIRNGRVTANAVTIHTPLLDDPIKEMHGFVQIVDNQLIINNLDGKMYKSSRRRSNRNDNVSLTGGMDMTKFFDPYINVTAAGEEAYFRSLIYEMEGITDFDITISGRDTLLFSGEVAPIDVEMFQSLTTSELGVLPSEEGSTIIHYKIDLPIKGKFTLTNDQLDAVLIGDVSINQFGDEEMDFAGELVIDEGKLYYYGDVFTIEDGYLTFDNRGFNPYLDVSAYTIIDGERIDISIVGELDNPLLTFSSESGFSQSDILELLTWRRRFEEQEFSSTGIGFQASDLVLSWFGSQLDKNIMKMSGLDRLGILENVDVRGTSGLITAEEDFSISAPLTDIVAINYAYRRSFGITDSYHSLGVELRLNRNLSLVGNIDRSGYMHVKYRLRYAY